MYNTAIPLKDYAMRILYLDLDTLRPDHLGCYGYPRQTSPNIDRIAARGMVFDRVYCADAPCLPSRTGLMTGRFGIHSGVVGHSGTSADLRIDGAERGFRDRLSSSSLPAVLKQAGLHTVYVGGFGERHSSWSYYAGFREIYDTGKGGMESAEDVTPAALDWIERNAHKDNWYLHINYWDPHTPYRAPQDFGNPFLNDPVPTWVTAEILAQHRHLPGPHSAQDLCMYDNRTDPRYPRHPGELKDLGDLRRLVDGYDCGIAYMDQHIGQVMAALEQALGAKSFEDLVIIISSDHGENQGELGIYAEHGTADHATCHIPLIIRWPGMTQAKRDHGLHYQLDLSPTLADLLGVPAPSSWEGRSFADAVRSGADCGREFLVLSQCAHVCQRSVRWGPWLYMRTYHDGFRLLPDEMLFNLEQDPYEQEDLAGEIPEICREGLGLLTAWHDAMMANMPGGPDRPDPLRVVLAEGGPTHARGVLAEYCQRLEATGRGQHIPELKRKHPREFTE
jgi:arylsulfatase A-like enzyme